MAYSALTPVAEAVFEVLQDSTLLATLAAAGTTTSRKPDVSLRLVRSA